MAIVWAIVANTMPAAFWVLYFLLVHADARAAAMSELHRSGALASSADDAPVGIGGVGLTPTALESMPALDSIIIETLRITSGSITMREVVAKEGMQLQVTRALLTRATYSRTYLVLTHSLTPLTPRRSFFNLA